MLTKKRRAVAATRKRTAKERAAKEADDKRLRNALAKVDDELREYAEKTKKERAGRVTTLKEHENDLDFIIAYLDKRIAVFDGNY